MAGVAAAQEIQGACGGVWRECPAQCSAVAKTPGGGGGKAGYRAALTLRSYVKNECASPAGPASEKGDHGAGTQGASGDDAMRPSVHSFHVDTLRCPHHTNV